MIITYLKWLKKIVAEDCGMFLDLQHQSNDSVQLIDSHFSHRPGYIALLVTLKAGVIYTQCALVHTRVRVLYRVRIFYPVRNA